MKKFSFVVFSIFILAGCGGGGASSSGHGTNSSGGISTIDINVHGLRVTRSANNIELSCRVTITLTSKVNAHTSSFTFYTDAYDASGRMIARSTIPARLSGLKPRTYEDWAFRRSDSKIELPLKTCDSIAEMRHSISGNSIRRFY